MRQLEQAIRDLRLCSRVPGLQYVVVDARSTLVERCVGYARLPNRPMTPDTTMMAYSMSKTITAAAVLQLAEQGNLGLEDAVSHYIPWQPYGRHVTVRGLLSHTAGLPNPIPLRWVHPAQDHPRFNEGAALRDVLSKHRKLAASPGARYRYSNIGYWLLGPLVERVTGESFVSYVTNHLLTPLNLNAGEMSYVIMDPRGHATGYLERFSFLSLIKPMVLESRLIDGSIGRWVAIRPHYVNGPAFGGLVGTARAFGTFLQEQLRDQSKLFGRTTQAYLIEQQRTSHGPIPMTLGWHMGRVDQFPYFFKEGGGGGFRSMMRLYKSHGIGSVLMTNATTIGVGRVLDALDSLLLNARTTRM